MFAARFLPFTVTGLRLVTRPIPRGIVPFWTGHRPGHPATSARTRWPPSSTACSSAGSRPSSKRRRAITAPALVVGHPADPIHPAADAAMLAEEMPNATFVKARSILEWRFAPDRLNRIAAGFALRCWADQGAVGVVPARDRRRATHDVAR